jgi:hypothetical protein
MCGMLLFVSLTLCVGATETAPNDADLGEFNHFVQHAASHTPVATRSNIEIAPLPPRFVNCTLNMKKPFFFFFFFFFFLFFLTSYRTVSVLVVRSILNMLEPPPPPVPLPLPHAICQKRVRKSKSTSAAMTSATSSATTSMAWFDDESTLPFTVVEPLSDLSFGVHSLGTPVTRHIVLAAKSSTAPPIAVLAVSSSCDEFRVRLADRRSFIGSSDVRFPRRAQRHASHSGPLCRSPPRSCRVPRHCSHSTRSMACSCSCHCDSLAVSASRLSSTPLSLSAAPGSRPCASSIRSPTRILACASCVRAASAFTPACRRATRRRARPGSPPCRPLSRNASSGGNVWHIPARSDVVVGYLNVQVQHRQPYVGFVAVLLTTGQWIVLPVAVAGVNNGVHVSPSVFYVWRTCRAGRSSQRRAARRERLRADRADCGRACRAGQLCVPSQSDQRLGANCVCATATIACWRT